MTYTQTLNLKKPDYDDVVDIEVINQNMDTIDEIIAKNSERFVDLIASVTIPAGSKIATSPITEEIYKKYNMIFTICTNNEDYDIYIYIGNYAIGKIIANEPTCTATLNKSYEGLYTYFSYSINRTTNYTLSTTNSTVNDFIIDFYGVEFA